MTTELEKMWYLYCDRFIRNREKAGKRMIGNWRYYKDEYKYNGIEILRFWRFKSKIDTQKALIEEQRKQLLSEKKSCEWFYDELFSALNDEYKEHPTFEELWQIHISSMPEDIQKRKEMRSQKK